MRRNGRRHVRYFLNDDPGDRALHTALHGVLLPDGAVRLGHVLVDSVGNGRAARSSRRHASGPALAVGDARIAH